MWKYAIYYNIFLSLRRLKCHVNLIGTYCILNTISANQIHIIITLMFYELLIIAYFYAK